MTETPIRIRALDRLANPRLVWTTMALAIVASVALTTTANGDKTVQVSHVDQVIELYRSLDYPSDALHKAGASVPQVYVSAIPEHWAQNVAVAEKKDLFFRTMLPLVLRANEEIVADRERAARLTARLDKDLSVSAADRRWLLDLATTYRVIDAKDRDSTGGLTPAQGAALLERVGRVPVSLALAQAAVESAYASSKFAVEGNALFGQWQFGSGLKPAEQRRNLGDYRIAQFATPEDSVRAYMLNLNRNPAYKPFRDIRTKERNAGTTFSGPALAEGLRAYSERGESYVALLRSIIAHDRLAPTDSAVLRDMEPIKLVPVEPPR